jgi:FkbM family methyltransferase
MRVLFILKQTGYVRHFDTVIEALAARGHVVRVAGQDEEPLPEALASLENVYRVSCPKKRGDAWRDYASLLRRGADYLRYLEPAYRGATKLRARAFEKLVSTLSDRARIPEPGWSDRALGLTDRERERLRGLLEAVETAIPSDRAFDEFLQEQAPDVVLITPLIDLGSGQADFVKSARSLGIPAAMVLFSWDNLSTKGGIHTPPDRLFVWNERQRREAADLHGVDPATVVVTGAPRFDRFFACRPATTRSAFCEPLGLDPSKPIVLYLGSSKFVTEDERPVIAEWIDRIRRAPDPALREANLLVKPHPDLNRAWDAPEATHVRWEAMPQARVRLTKPFAAERVAVVLSTFTGAQFLYDCLHHSASVVGLNTSAELEAGIVGRPVCTLRLADDVADGQAGTLHFHYLLAEEGGFVRTAESFGEHLAHLADALAGRFDAERTRRFIREFLRPAGLDRAATDVLVESVQDFATAWPARAGAPGGRAVAASETRRDLDPREPSGGAPDGNGSAARILLDYERHPIWLYVTSDPERHWRARTCAKEPWTVDWIETHIKEGDVFYDIGANVGAFSLIAAKRCRNNLTVVAFEPGYSSFAHLCDNIVLNACDRSIIPIPLPLGAATGLAGFKYRSLHPGQSRHALREAMPLPRKGKDKQSGRYEQPVLAMRLDELVSRFQLPPPTHIKLDVDGAELKVLEGAGPLLDGPSLRTVLMEVAETLTESVTCLLQKKGFRLASRHQRKQKPGAPWYGVFLRATA